MAGKLTPTSDGLHQQIDELDALLDRLLQIPLGPVPIPSVKSNTAFKLVGAGDSLLEAMDEAAELEEPVLQFHPNEDLAAVAAKSTGEPRPITSEFGTFPVLKEDPRVPDEPSDVLPLAAEPDLNQRVDRFDPQGTPWIEDEPGPKPGHDDSAEDASVAPRSALRQIQGAGPRIEIVQGSLTTSVLLPEGTQNAAEAGQSARPVGFLRRACWFATFLFDVTLGLLFPGMRRSRGKRFLGIAGVGLLGASAYLAWKWWW